MLASASECSEESHIPACKVRKAATCFYRSPISSKQLHNHSCTTAEYQSQCRRSLGPRCNQASQTTRSLSDSHFAPLGANEERGVRLVHLRIMRFHAFAGCPVGSSVANQEPCSSIGTTRCLESGGVCLAHRCTIRSPHSPFAH